MQWLFFDYFCTQTKSGNPAETCRPKCCFFYRCIQKKSPVTRPILIPKTKFEFLWDPCKICDHLSYTERWVVENNQTTYTFFIIKNFQSSLLLMSKKWDLPTAWALIWAQMSLHCYQRLATPIATLANSAPQIKLKAKAQK